MATHPGVYYFSARKTTSTQVWQRIGRLKAIPSVKSPKCVT